MTIDRRKNTTIIINKEDIRNPNNEYFWEGLLDLLHIDRDATEVAVSRKANGLAIVLDKEDVPNLNLWRNWMDTLELNPDTESVFLYLSLLDGNKKL